MSVANSAFSGPAMFADQDRTKGMPIFMHAMCMVVASIIIIETGVFTSVSLFALVLILSLVLLGVLLTLSGLTGLIDLVGLIKELDPGTAQGD